MLVITLGRDGSTRQAAQRPQAQHDPDDDSDLMCRPAAMAMKGSFQAKLLL